MADSIQNAPAPRFLPPDAQEALKDQLSQQAEPVKEKAAETFAAAVAMSRELGISNSCPVASPAAAHRLPSGPVPAHAGGGGGPHSSPRARPRPGPSGGCAARGSGRGAEGPSAGLPSARPLDGLLLLSTNAPTFCSRAAFDLASRHNEPFLPLLFLPSLLSASQISQ